MKRKRHVRSPRKLPADLLRLRGPSTQHIWPDSPPPPARVAFPDAPVKDHRRRYAGHPDVRVTEPRLAPSGITYDEKVAYVRSLGPLALGESIGDRILAENLASQREGRYFGQPRVNLDEVWRRQLGSFRDQLADAEEAAA